MSTPTHVVCTRPAPLDSRAEQTMVAMRDKVRLATDVYLPARPGRLPAVLVRLPYDKASRDCFMPRLSACVNDPGYAFVVQDVRGKFRSEGETMPLAHEIEDGYDTLDWIAGRPWSNGSVGMWGNSYYGWTQWAAVASGHTALKAIVPRMTSMDFLESRRWWGDWVTPLYLADYLARYWLDRFEYRFAVDWAHRPLAEAFDAGFAAVGSRSAAFDRLMVQRGSGGFSVFPRGRHPADLQRVPALHTVGWFDCIGALSMRDYTALLAAPARSRLQYFLGDAVDHDDHHLSPDPLPAAGDHHDDDAMLERIVQRIIGPGLDFFDVFVKGRGDFGTLPRARWRLGHGGCGQSAAWPPSEAREMRLHLSSAQRAADGPEGGELTSSEESLPTRAHWVHDPGDLVPSAVADPFTVLMDRPDEREIECREDVLTFTGAPLERPLDLAGPVTAVLELSSRAESMHVHVKLLDVGPDGDARMLLRGQAHVAASDLGRRARIELGHTGYRLAVGHRLRVHLAASDFPLFLWHPGTRENPWLATEGIADHLTLVTGASHGSYVSLSVLEPGERHGSQ